MNNPQQHPHTGAPPEKSMACLEAIIRQAERDRQDHLDDLFRRLGRGERLGAVQVHDTLRAQTLCTWWRLVARHLEHADGGGLHPAQAVARFVSWIRPYATDPTPPNPTPPDPISLDPSQDGRTRGQDGERAFALAHLDHSLALIRQDAARAFLTQAETLVPACSPQQSPSASAGQEATA
ncbi:hypothetical protein [Nonomuraea angiospora]